MARVIAAALIVGLALMSIRPAHAETTVLRGGMQWGFSYLQLILMQDQKLVEQHAKKAGLGDLKVEWTALAGPAPLTDALLSNSIDFAAMGLPNMITLWARTRGSIDVKAVSGMNAHPLLLVTRNPRIKSLKDYTDKDRIALPSVKISMQAILLQIAARDLFGDANWAKLDPMTVSMAHPDSVAAVLSSAGDIESHFSSPPFQARELAAPGVHLVVSSYDIIGGAHAVSNITMTSKFRSQNPKTVAVLMSALAEATEWVKRDKKFAAEAYIRVTKDKTPADALVKIIDEANIEFTLAPRGAQRVADFLHHIGSIKVKPADWREMYFPEAHGLPGN